MRIGLTSPRINGLPMGMGDAPHLADSVAQFLASYMAGLSFAVEHGSATSPGNFASYLAAQIQGLCAGYTTAECDPASVSSQVASAITTYTAAYNLAQQQYANSVAAGRIVSYATPAVAPVSTAQVQYSSQPSNALDRVTPQRSVVLTAPVSSALAPPVAVAPVVSANAGTFTSTGTTTTPAGATQTQNTTPSTSFFDQTISIGSVNIPTWVLLAGAGVGLFVMAGKGKGK